MHLMEITIFSICHVIVRPIDRAADCFGNRRDAERVPYLRFIQLISNRKKLTESIAKTGNEPL